MSKRKKPPRGVFVRDGEYWIRYADQFGKMHREKAGPLVSEAVAAYQTRKSEVRAGKFFPDQFKRRPLLFGEVAKEYLKLARARKRSWRGDEDHLEALKALNDVPIADLTPARLENVISDLAEEREWAQATFNRHKSTVSGVFKYAIRAEKAQMNPAREIKKRAEENTRVRYLRAEEEAALMKAVREQSPEREVEILVALHSGMRRSEQYRTAQVADGGLKWEHVNLRAGVIRLPRSKSTKPRHIPMNSVLRRMLASIPRMISTPLVFSGEPDKWFAELCAKAKITDFTWHDLRHTFASRLVMAGVPIRAVSELMGHSDITTTVRYAHLAPQYLADAVECLAQNPPPTSTATGTEI
jgi:site-specific recombinase XerD